MSLFLMDCDLWVLPWSCCFPLRKDSPCWAFSLCVLPDILPADVLLSCLILCSLCGQSMPIRQSCTFDAQWTNPTRLASADQTLRTCPCFDQWLVGEPILPARRHKRSSCRSLCCQFFSEPQWLSRESIHPHGVSESLAPWLYRALLDQQVYQVGWPVLC